MSAEARAVARLFVALDLPETVRRELERRALRLAAAEPALRAVRAESMHLTLCFLGNRPVSQIDAIGAAVGAAAGPPALELRSGAVIGLPARRPRVLAAAIEDRGSSLGRLQGRLASALAELGAYRLERRAFVAHVTIARVRGRGSLEIRRVAGRSASWLHAPVTFVASSVTLLRSSPSPAGQVYEPLRSARLAL